MRKTEPSLPTPPQASLPSTTCPATTGKQLSDCCQLPRMLLTGPGGGNRKRLLEAATRTWLGTCKEQLLWGNQDGSQPGMDGSMDGNRGREDSLCRGCSAEAGL